MATTKFRGFQWDDPNTRLKIIVNNTVVAYLDNADPYITSPVGLTVTTGNLTVTAGDERITAGNLRLGAVSAFATTEPTSAAIFKSGTAPSGAITTSSGLYANDTVLRKVIAAGTLSNVG